MCNVSGYVLVMKASVYFVEGQAYPSSLRYFVGLLFIACYSCNVVTCPSIHYLSAFSIASLDLRS